MSDLREMIKHVNWYVDKIANDPMTVKKDCEYYIEDVNMLREDLNLYIKEVTAKFEEWSNKSLEVWLWEDKNIFARIKRHICMVFVNHKLYNFSGKIARAQILTRNIDVVSGRLEQFHMLSLQR